MQHQRLLVITHQLPWLIDSNNNFILKRGHSTQFSGTNSLNLKTIHFGHNNDFSNDQKLNLFKKLNGVVVEYPDNISKGHYEGYCKSELWPLFHYVLWDNATDGILENKNYHHYCKVNQAFADAVLLHYQPGDLIWIQDYHFMLLPALLRAALPNAAIGFFLHTPFPSSEIFRCLPRRSEILKGLLGANVIGFQTYSHARHFISSCTRVIGCESSPTGVEYQGFNITIGIFPIGIDINRVETYRQSQAVQNKIKHISTLYKDKIIIIGRDSMDHIKGISQKLDAFEKFLELYPEWHNKVVLIQVSTSSNKANPNIAAKISDSIARINGNFGSLEFVPVHHYHHHLDPEEYFALMSIADVALITPLRDGMNTTSHDYVVCQKGNHGILILSEFTGTAGAMAGAILVNPWDTLGVANAIQDALTKSIEDRQIKHDQLYSYVTSHTSQFWAQSFIKELISKSSVQLQDNPTPVLDFANVHQQYTQSQRRLLLFDYDGTLTPIVKLPKDAVPPPAMLEALKVLVADPKNVVFIISGRDQDALEEWLGHIKGLGLSAEHGSFIKYPGGKWLNLAAELDMAWKVEVAEIFNYYTERTQGSFVEHKRCSITWHYRLADPSYGLFQAKECQHHLEDAILSKLPVEVMVGKKNLEVRPISMNKGEIVKRLVTARTGCDFVICAGDDRTDEDMFRVLRKSQIREDGIFTVTIGSATKMTRADSHVTEPADLIRLLQLLAGTQPCVL
ncbi:glycosyltransferase family 20-domain-containing protein [Globomyces pollinis-pini]|nr:glycosyltransferase family 20-domain-containing protein [Globomyces pollinis-pini]